MDPAIAQALDEIAQTNGVRLGADDPVMVVHTLQRRLLAQFEQAQNEQFEVLRAELGAISAEWEQGATAKGERVVNAALAGCQALLRQEFEAAAQRAVSTMGEAFEAQWRRAMRQARIVVLVNLLGALGLMAGAVFWVVASVG